MYSVTKSTNATTNAKPRSKHAVFFFLLGKKKGKNKQEKSLAKGVHPDGRLGDAVAGVPALGVQEVVEHGEDRGEDDEGRAGGEHALPQHLARRVVHEVEAPVPRVPRVLHRSRKQARLRHQKRQP